MVIEIAPIVLGTVEQIQNVSAGIGINLASQILINMAKDGETAALATLAPELNREMDECVVCCLRDEPNVGYRKLLVECLFDDVSIHKIVTSFIAGDCNETLLIEIVKSRLPEGHDWENVESTVAQASSRFLERFKQVISSNQTLFNRLNIGVWERGAQQGTEIREIKSLVMEIAAVQKSVADFPSGNKAGAKGSAAISNSSSLPFSGGDFPIETNTAVAFLKDDFESALNELKFGSAKKARAGFEVIVARLDRIGVDVDRNLYFRAKCNLGLAAYAAGGSAEFAADCLENAFPFADGSLKGRVNLAIAKSLRRKEEEAVTILSAVLIEEPGNFDALVNRGDCLLKINKPEEALDDFRKAKPLTRENKVILASAFLSANAFDEAIHAAKDALAEFPDDPWAKIALSTAIGLPIVEISNEDKLASGFRPLEHLESIKQALSLLEEALPRLRSSDRPDRLCVVLSNAAAFSSVLGDHRQALRYADEAAALPEAEESVHRNRFLAAVLTGQFQKALESADALQQWMSPDEALLRRVEALKGLRRFKEGLDCIETVQKKTGAASSSAYLRILEVDLNLGLPDIEKADQLAVTLKNDFPEDSIVWLTCADLAHSRDKIIEEECLRKALEVADTIGLRLQCRAMLGQFLGRNARWREALEMLLPEGKEQEYQTPLIGEIAICHFNLGEYSEALRMAKSRLQIGYEYNACDLAIQSCLAMVELEKAKEFALLMKASDSRNQVAAWEYLAHLEFRLNRPQEARRILVSALAGNPDSRLYLLLGNICLHLGQHLDAVKNAVEALRVAHGDEAMRCHSAIVRFACCLPPSTKVGKPLRGRIHRSTKILAGAKGSGVTAIHAEEDFATLRGMLEKQQKAASEGVRLFSERGFPIYALTYMSGRDIYAVWSAIVCGNGLRLNMSNGSAEQQVARRLLAWECSGVVLEATALLTFQHLGMLEKLPEMFGRIVVSFPVYERFVSLLNEAKHGPRSDGWVGLVDQSLHLRELAAGEKEAIEMKFLEPIVEFLEKVERVGFQEPVESNNAGTFLKESNFESWSTVLVAKQLGLPILSDDVGTLEAANLACGVNGFCSQTALQIGNSKNVVSNEEYADSVVRLFESNYHFVSEDADAIISYLERRQWVLDSTLRRLFERFDSGEVKSVAACRILGGVLAHAWLRAQKTGSDKKAWIAFVCERLRAIGNSSENFRTALVGAIKMYWSTPDLFVGLIFAICDADGMPQDLIVSIKTSAASFMRIIASGRFNHLGVDASRWDRLAKCFD